MEGWRKKQQAHDEKFAKSLAKLLISFPNNIRKDIEYTTFRYPINYNSDGFRSPEFEKNIDLLSVGCSFTFGTGLPREFVWDSMLAKDNNLTYNSIGVEGGSCMYLVFNTFKYFEKYGHPKMLIALIPDFYRTYTYLDGKVLNTTKMFNSLKISNDNIFTNDSGPGGPVNDSKFLALPTTADKIYSREFAYMLNAFYLKMLEIYCDSHNIPFLWVKWWNDPIDHLLELDNFPNIKLKNHHEDMIKYSIDYHPKTIDGDCHKEYHSKVLEDPSLWHTAKDGVHNGLHWQLHVKEIFESVLKQKSLLK